MSHYESLRDEPCDQCDSITYYLIDGIKVCDNGHEQGTQIVGQDGEDLEAAGQRVRKKKEKRKHDHTKVYRGTAAFRLFVQAYQFIIWKQCHTLIHQKGLPGELWTIVRDLWALRLSQLIGRLEEPSTIERPNEASVTDLPEKETQESSENSIQGIGHLKLEETIGLCYLGALILRFPLALSTLYRWVQEQEVVYIQARQVIPDDMIARLPGEYHEALGAKDILNPASLELAVSNLVVKYHRAFGLVVPKINHKVLLFRYVSDLSLPLEVMQFVEQLAVMAQSEFCYVVPARNTRRTSLAFPDRQLMCLVVVAVKLLYPFEGEQPRARKIDEPVTLRLDWKSWAAHYRHHQNTSSHSVPTGHRKIETHDNEVFGMTLSDLDTYMDWYQETWLRNQDRDTEDNDNIHQQILEMFPLKTLDRTPINHVDLPDSDQTQHETAYHRLRAVTAELQFKPPIIEEETSKRGLAVRRPGEGYRIYRKVEQLPASAIPFFEVAAELACTSVSNLVRGVAFAESRIDQWRKRSGSIVQ